MHAFSLNWVHILVKYTAIIYMCVRSSERPTVENIYTYTEIIKRHLNEMRSETS